MVQIGRSGIITGTTPDIMLMLAVTTLLVVVVGGGGGGEGGCLGYCLLVRLFITSEFVWVGGEGLSLLELLSIRLPVIIFLVGKYF